MKKLLFLFIGVLLFSSAFALSVQITPVDNSGRPGDILEYSIYLSNPATTEKTVLMYMISTLSNTFEPAYQITVPASGSETITLYLNLPTSVTEGRYYDSVYFDIDNLIQDTQTISYSVEGPEQYYDFKSLSVPSQVDPREQFNITLNIENGYEAVERVYATIEVYEEDGTDLFYSVEVIDTLFGNNSIDLPVILNPELSPTTANVRVSLSWYNSDMGSLIQPFSIIGYELNTTEPVSSTTITSTTSGKVITNNGTLALQSFDYEIPLNQLDVYFIFDASVDYTLTSESIIFHVPELLPGESIELSYESSYSIMYLLPFALIGLVYLFYYFTRTISVKKEVYEMKRGLNYVGFKIVLKITNISNKKIKRLRVVEPLPPIISQVYDYGTLHGELKTTKGQKNIRWNLGILKPNEEVILSYKVKSKIGLVGELRLDKGFVEVRDANSQVISKVSTNTIIIQTSKK